MCDCVNEWGAPRSGAQPDVAKVRAGGLARGLRWAAATAAAPRSTRANPEVRTGATSGCARFAGATAFEPPLQGSKLIESPPSPQGARIPTNRRRSRLQNAELMILDIRTAMQLAEIIGAPCAHAPP